MPVFGWLLLIAAVGGAAFLQYIINRGVKGPSHCMGCGKCDKTGVCILTGEPVGPQRKSKS